MTHMCTLAHCTRLYMCTKTVKLYTSTQSHSTGVQRLMLQDFTQKVHLYFVNIHYYYEHFM